MSVKEPNTHTLNARMEALRQKGLIPDRLIHAPVSPEGYIVPWFVHWKDGVPDFRVIESGKLWQAISAKKCWICGEGLGRFMAFTAGPMCGINRTSAEPPSHRECAIFAAIACPFLTQPRMRRNEKDLPEHRLVPGTGLKRNPGVTMVWVTKSYEVWRPGSTPSDPSGKGVLLRFGDPTEVIWFCEGRPATRAEVQASVDSGFPLLYEPARLQGREAVAQLAHQVKVFDQYLPISAGA